MLGMEWDAYLSLSDGLSLILLNFTKYVGVN